MLMSTTLTCAIAGAGAGGGTTGIDPASAASGDTASVPAVGRRPWIKSWPQCSQTCAVSGTGFWQTLHLIVHRRR